MMISTGDSDEYSYPLHMSGYASTLPPDDAFDPLAALHEVVKEITGRPVEKPQPNRIGFI